jgi:16S rRNA A1518/A1519 N6-dimethyltransferase RsmA/KsgA/DIM1 with predicted DNA glycosylase/AP lyase activity
MTFQREFVKKLTAQKGNSNYGSLSVIASYSATINELEDVSNQSFYPPPNIDSTIVLIEPQKPLFDVGDKDFYFKLVKSCFTQRNKKVHNALKQFIQNEFNLTKNMITKIVKEFPYHDSRVYELTPEALGEISYQLHNLLNKETT